MLFNEPKLLKLILIDKITAFVGRVSVLFNEPKLLKLAQSEQRYALEELVSVLFNEPKLLKLQQALDAMTELVKFQCSSTSRNC